VAADGCLIPFDCDEFSRQALYTLLDNVREIRADHNPKLQVNGIVVNQFQARAKLPQRMVDELLAEGLPVLHGARCAHHALASLLRLRQPP
jgi:chromosome partitioning protein